MSQNSILSFGRRHTASDYNSKAVCVSTFNDIFITHFISYFTVKARYKVITFRDEGAPLRFRPT